MMMFGPQSGYILASYALAALILGAMIAASLVGRARARRRLADLEQAGADHE